MIEEQSKDFLQGNLMLLSCLGLLKHAKQFESFLERQCRIQAPAEHVVASTADQSAQTSFEDDEALLFVLGLLRVSRLVLETADAHSLDPSESPGESTSAPETLSLFR